MTVRSMHTVLTECAVQHLSSMVPEDVEAVVNVAVTNTLEQCDEGHLGMTPTVRVDLWCRFTIDETPTSGRFSEISSAYDIPLWMVKDGDTAPLTRTLDALWEQAQFMVVMAGALPEMQEAYAEAGPFPDEDED